MIIFSKSLERDLLNGISTKFIITLATYQKLYPRTKFWIDTFEKLSTKNVQL